LSVCEVA